MALESFSFSTQVLAEVLVAAVLAGALGLERELARRPAGLRTHMLVAVSACVLVALGEAISQRNIGSASGGDPIRIIEAIVTGVAFLGAGTIFRSPRGDSVRGLTTAATLLVAATLGVAVALHYWALAGGVTLIVLLIVRGLGWWEQRLHDAMEPRIASSTSASSSSKTKRE